MSPSAAARIEFIEKPCIGMCTEYHVASLIDNDVVWISCHVVKK